MGVPRSRGPDELTYISSRGETFIVRTEPAGSPQGWGIASLSLTLLSLLRALGDRSWHLRVRRYADDPIGPVLYHEVAESREDAVERLTRVREDIERARWPWEEAERREEPPFL